MPRFILRRALIGLVQVWIALTLIFFAIHLIPGDPVRTLLTAEGGVSDPSPHAVARLREDLGVGDPLPLQYLDFLRGLLTGDLGTSFVNSTPVTELIWTRVPNTLEVVFLAALLGSLAGLGLGAVIGRGGRLSQLIGSAVTSLSISIPIYVLGSMFALVFALHLGWLPSGGFRAVNEDLGEHLKRLILPTAALAIPLAGIVARTASSSIREFRGQDWVRTGRAIGLSERRVFRTHVLRNSLIPVVTIVGVEIGTLIGGTVLIERVFNWPGLGTLLVEGVGSRDYPVVQGVVGVIAVLFIVINILVDVIYGWLDPRIGRS